MRPRLGGARLFRNSKGSELVLENSTGLYPGHPVQTALNFLEPRPARPFSGWSPSDRQPRFHALWCSAFVG